MPKKLGFHVGYRIVSEALDRVEADWKIVTPETSINEILPDVARRRAFQDAVREVVKEYGKEHRKRYSSASLSKLRAGPKTTIDQLTNIVGGLPGDPGTGDDD